MRVIDKCSIRRPSESSLRCCMGAELQMQLVQVGVSKSSMYSVCMVEANQSQSPIRLANQVVRVASKQYELQ